MGTADGVYFRGLDREDNALLDAMLETESRDLTAPKTRIDKIPPRVVTKHRSFWLR